MPSTVRAEALVVPVSPLRLPRRGAEGTTRGGPERVRRLIHVGGAPVLLEAALAPGGALALQADAPDAEAAATGLARLRFWTGVDDDVGPFLERFAEDPLIGPSVREAPWTRPFRRPMPFEVLACAVCEQLIDDERSVAIKRAIIRRHGPRAGELRDVPDAARVAGLAPAELEACGLAPAHAATLVRAARGVQSGRVDLLAADPLPGWRRLRALPGIGPWTLSVLALHGQGRFDALPAGDHAYRTLVGEARTGRPGAQAAIPEVVAFFAPYAGWRGLAGWHLLRTAGRRRAAPGDRRR